MDNNKNKNERDLKIERLNVAAKEWCRVKNEVGNEAVADSLRNELFTLSYDLFDPQDKEEDTTYFFLTFNECLKKYDPEKSKFSSYLRFIKGKRKIDQKRKKKRHAPDHDSLNIELPDNDTELMDVLPDRISYNPEDAAINIDKVDELAALIIDFMSRMDTNAQYKIRTLWYRIFFTEDITYGIQVSGPLPLNERLIFSAIKEEYLDFFMSSKCRTIEAICQTPLKKYREVCDGNDKDVEIPLPIPVAVSLSYLSRVEGISVGESARSNQISFYKKLKDDLYQC